MSLSQGSMKIYLQRKGSGQGCLTSLTAFRKTRSRNTMRYSISTSTYRARHGISRRRRAIPRSRTKVRLFPPTATWIASTRRSMTMTAHLLLSGRLQSRRRRLLLGRRYISGGGSCRKVRSRSRYHSRVASSLLTFLMMGQKDVLDVPLLFGHFSHTSGIMNEEGTSPFAEEG
ncbi:hypothetical protein NEOLEDRAFT_316956 [Neolentinus lepideus HHB14362 ss-1]|uniref:Uncharacterized protein n=1 Tax=Neolentinus lepideus HHB14362 ss-1 TaxID=1314782 RepID=A0A165VU83_9AGAM|nr:hypothetical protein NEOLEDRAFT_316956 [Neolentinus lepideus HHB14362 ss-1]